MIGSWMFIFMAQVTMAQDTITYDAKWKPTQAKDYHFYRVKKNLDQGGFLAKDYFRDGTLQMDGNFSSEDIREGLFTYYYDNGKPQSRGEYSHNLHEGLWTSWYKNGNIENKGSYLHDKADGEWTYYYESGNKKSVFHYVEDVRSGAYEAWYENGQKREELSFVADTIQGDIQTWYANGQVRRQEEYQGNRRTKAVFYDSLGHELPFVEYLISPEFPGGTEGLLAFLGKHLHYNKKARRKGIEGRVLVYFEVDPHGVVGNVSIANSLDPLLDEDALRVIRNMPAWKPGRLDGDPIMQSFTIPIKFQLEE